MPVTSTPIREIRAHYETQEGDAFFFSPVTMKRTRRRFVGRAKTLVKHGANCMSFFVVSEVRTRQTSPKMFEFEKVFYVHRYDWARRTIHAFGAGEAWGTIKDAKEDLAWAVAHRCAALGITQP